MDTVLRTQQPGWQARLEGAADGEYECGDGTVKPGTEYTIGLWHAGGQQTIRVRAFLADDLTPEARSDLQFRGQSVLRYVFSRLENGWTPAQGGLPPLRIENPGPSYRHASAAPRPTFMQRLIRNPSAPPAPRIASDESNPEWIQEI